MEQLYLYGNWVDPADGRSDAHRPNKAAPRLSFADSELPAVPTKPEPAPRPVHLKLRTKLNPCRQPSLLGPGWPGLPRPTS